MKISIKEIKVEDDGSEMLYVRDFGFILKSDTFSGALKCWHEKGKDKEKEEKGQEMNFEGIDTLLEQIVLQFSPLPPPEKAQPHAEDKAPQDQSKEPVAGTKVPVKE